MENEVNVFTKLDTTHTWSKLIEVLCNRPRMFTRHGSFDEIFAWLQGFVAGLDECNPDATLEWVAFINWLHTKYNTPANYVWSFIIREHSSQNNHLELLLLLFKEYKNTNGVL